MQSCVSVPLYMCARVYVGMYMCLCCVCPCVCACICIRYSSEVTLHLLNVFRCELMTACEVFESNLIVCIDGLDSVAQGKMASYNAIDNIVSLSDFISKFHFLFLLNTQQTHKTELITVNKG